MLKDFFELWQLGEVTAIASELPHGTDGLVFTPVMVPYVPGTVPALLKWKPAEMNTVDFKLQVIKGGDSARNMHVKLLVGFKSKDAWQVKHTGHWLAKTGDMFKKLREDPAAFDGKIAECKWNASAKTFTPSDQLKFTVNGSWEDGGWVLQRLREDKSLPNDLRTAKRVVESIQDDLNEEDLLTIVLKAKEDGKLKAAAECGSGHLPRVQPNVDAQVKNWATAADETQMASKGEARSQGKGKERQTKGKGKEGQGKGKGKARGKSKDMAKAGDASREEGAPAQVQHQRSADSKGKAKGSGKKGSKGKAKKTRQAKLSAEEEDMNLMQWSQQLEGGQAEATSLAEPPTATSDSELLPLSMEHAPPPPGPGRVRTVADLMEQDPEDVREKMTQVVRLQAKKRQAPFTSPPSRTRARTAADAGAADSEPLPLLRRSGLKRKPRLPGLSDAASAPGEPVRQMPVADERDKPPAPPTNLALGFLHAGYVPPVLPKVPRAPT